MSFTLFNAIKKRRKTKEEHQSLIKEYDNYYKYVNEKIDYYKKYVKDNYPEYEHSNRYTSALLSMKEVKPRACYSDLDKNLRIYNSYLVPYTLENIVERHNKCASKLREIVKKEIEKVAKAKEGSKISAAAFEEFVRKPSMFFVLENIFDGNKLYCFCYEFQAVNKDGRRMARALITDNETEHCWIKEIKPEEDKIRSMTPEEFEGNFLKERIELQEFSKEEDIIEYDNYLRRLFNNQ